MSSVHIGLPILQMVVKGDWTVKQTGKDNSILVNKNQTGQAPLITDRFSISFPSCIVCNFWTNHAKSQQKSSDQFKVIFNYPNEGFTLASPRNILFSLQILVNKNQTGQAPLITDRYGDIWEVCVCVFIPSPVREGSTLFGDHRGYILSNRAETSQEGQCGRPPEEISAQSNLGQEKTNSKHG